MCEVIAMILSPHWILYLQGFDNDERSGGKSDLIPKVLFGLIVLPKTGSTVHLRLA